MTGNVIETEQVNEAAPSNVPAIMPRSYGGVPTWEKYGEHKDHPYDEAAIEKVLTPANAAYARAEAIAADVRLTPFARQTDVNAILSGGLQQALGTFDVQLQQVEHQLAETAKKARRPIAPKAEDVSQLNYVKDMLRERARAKTIDEAGLYQYWQNALDDADLITVRVFADFGDSLVQTLRPKLKGKDAFASALQAGINEPMLRTLQERTDRALSTREQREAGEALKKLEATRIRLHETRSTVERRLKGAQVRGNALIDGDRDATLEFLRR